MFSAELITKLNKMTEIKLHNNELEYIKMGVESNAWFGNDEKLAERILNKINQALNIHDVVEQSEQLKPMVFELANKLAIAGEGDAAVGMHRIHNRL